MIATHLKTESFSRSSIVLGNYETRFTESAGFWCGDSNVPFDGDKSEIRSFAGKIISFPHHLKGLLVVRIWPGTAFVVGKKNLSTSIYTASMVCTEFTFGTTVGRFES